MSDDLLDIPADEPTDLKSARGLIAQLQTLIATLTALITELRESLATKDAEIAELRRAILGPKSERTPKHRTSGGKRKKKDETEEEKAKRLEAARLKRKKNREEREAKMAEERVEHPAPTTCPKCGGTGPFTVLSPDITGEIEFLNQRLLRLVHVLEKRLCECGHIFTGEGPERVAEGGHYGPGLYAHAVVSKCADALPLNRITKRFARAGLHMARSTLTDLYHRAASLLEPIHRRLLELVAQSPYVNADETSQPVMDDEKCRRGFIWTFIASAELIIAYVFSPSRSGETPIEVLSGTTGMLQVDGYTGYNQVCLPEGRDRAGCISHCRRYFHKARDKCPEEADHSIRVIRQLYQVEYDAAERDIIGTDAHRLLRQHRSKPLLDEWKVWLEEKKGLHTPKSPMGRAIRYTLNQWEYLIRFLSDAKLRLDNNISESALRIIALGRDNFRWVGHDESGENLAILQTIVATCVANDVNPEEYIADVLLRVQIHPASQLDELLPMNWEPAA